MRLLVLICTVFFSLCMPSIATAQSSIEVELSKQGYADATITLLVKPSGSSSIGSALLPFRLSDHAVIRSADTISSNILTIGDDYTLISFLYPDNQRLVKLRIVDALEIISTGSKNRVRFSFDFGFSGFQKHSTLLGQNSETIDNYDLSIRLPTGIAEDDIAFAPRVGWTNKLPLVTLPGSEGRGKEVYVAFSNPFVEARWLAQVLIGAIAGIITIAVGGKLFSPRKMKIRTLIFIATLAALGIFLVYYFFVTLIEPLNFLAWVVGIAVTWPLLLIVCIYVVIRKLTDAEVVGSVQILGEHGTTPAHFVSIEVTDASLPDWKQVESIDDRGDYRIYVFCWKSIRNLQLSVNNPEFDAVTTETFTVSRGGQRQMVPITLHPQTQANEE